MNLGGWLYRLRLVGLAVGIVGVAVLVGVHPRGGWWGIAGTLAVIVAAISYAVGSLASQHLVGQGPCRLAERPR